MAQLLVLERDVESVLRTLNERADLCGQIAEQRAAQGWTAEHQGWLAAATQAVERDAAIRRLAEAGWIDPEAAQDVIEPF